VADLRQRAWPSSKSSSSPGERLATSPENDASVHRSGNLLSASRDVRNIPSKGDGVAVTLSSHRLRTTLLNPPAAGFLMTT
jgi:hypothetical protein